MSERVAVYVSIYEYDAAQFCEIVGDEPEFSGPFGTEGWVELTFSPCAGAMEEERKEAARQGLVFFGRHHGCTDHTAAVFCSNGDGELYSVTAVEIQGEIIPVTTHEWHPEKGFRDLPMDDGVKATFEEVWLRARGGTKEEDMDFGERLEANLKCSSNEKVIDQMGFHDPENVELLLAYIRVKLGKEVQPSASGGETKPKIEVTLELTESQWCELANSVASKAARVRRGDYDEDPEDDGDDATRWAEELDETYSIVSEALDRKGVAY